MSLKRKEIDEIERLTGQLTGHHAEISALSKKSPSDAVNAFKLKFINATVAGCNALLGKKYKPFDEFDCFDLDDVPSNSDVTFILAQYIQAIEKLRSDNIYISRGFWWYRILGSEESIRTAPPEKLKKE
ncbi:MAG TPA: hypothetical protein V6C81_07280 [Planktothrix sp.]|jgi:hypothetical protein